MLLHVQWRTNPERLDEVRVAKNLGPVRVWLKEGEGAIECAVRLIFPSASYIAPERFSCIGDVHFLGEALTGDGGRDPVLSVVPVPRHWVGARDAIERLLVSCGLRGVFRDRTLSVSGNCCPREVLRRAGVVFLALDNDAKSRLSIEQLLAAQQIARRLFGPPGEVAASLLDPKRGRSRTRELFGEKRVQRDTIAENEVLRVVEDLELRSILHFHCGSGRALLNWSEEALLEFASGVEPNLSKRTSAADRLTGIGLVFEGSVLEAVANMPRTDIAVVLKALPLECPTKMEWVGRMILRSSRSKWILCIEDTKKAAALSTWSNLWLEHQPREWSFGAGAYHAVLFRGREDVVDPKSVCSQGRLIETTKGLISCSVRQWGSTLDAFTGLTVDPRWLFYIPPGMASMQTEREDGYLEHPSEAFRYYKDQGIERLIVQEKHMGSRAVAVICRDEETSRRKFGSTIPGCIYTRNGRPFFEDASQVISELQAGLTRAKFWDRFKTDWVCLDGEILPWTLKADSLLRDHHQELLEVGRAELIALETIAKRFGLENNGSAERQAFKAYENLLSKYSSERGRALQFAPFHLIATEGRAHTAQTHRWHMDVLRRLSESAGVPFLLTVSRDVRLDSQHDRAGCVSWWEKISKSGGEGVVVKPLHFAPRGRRGAAQPAIKCRGKEHLRMVYGPDYDLPERRRELASRESLVNRRAKFREIVKQAAISLEGVDRFIAGEPIERVAECVRAVLALGEAF